MEEAGHASKVTEFGCSYRTLNKCFFICFMPLGQFPETLNSYFTVFTSSACFTRYQVCGICKTAIWEVEFLLNKLVIIEEMENKLFEQKEGPPKSLSYRRLKK